MGQRVVGVGVTEVMGYGYSDVCRLEMCTNGHVSKVVARRK